MSHLTFNLWMFNERVIHYFLIKIIIHRIHAGRANIKYSDSQNQGAWKYKY